MKKKKTKKIISVILIIPVIIALLMNAIIFIGPSVILGHNEEYVINDQNNEYAFTYHYNDLSNYVNLEQISPYFKSAIIASEDQRFYSHNGLDYRRIVASLIDNIKSQKIVAGGSTITQQLARTIYLNNEKSIMRKLKEAIIARKIELSYSKEQILEAYLNCIYFGHNIYGIEEASNYFFNKKPNQLTLGESALLAGIISSPSHYSPYVDIETSLAKQKQVLKKMLNQNKINNQEYDLAINENLKFAFNKKYQFSNRNTLYFYDAIIDELKNNNVLKSNYKKKGVIINSTLDVKINNIVNNIIKSYHINEKESQVAVVIMKPNSGDVLAINGGVNYDNSQFNRATKSLRQTGSTIKPLLYYLAMVMGMDVKTKLISQKTTFHLENGKDYSPSNAGEKYANKAITMLEALAVSDNIYATKTLLLVGSENLKDLLIKLGVKDAVNNATIGLGTNVMSPLQLAAIFNTFASLGHYYKPRFVKSVYLENNQLIYNNPSVNSYNLDENIVTILNYMLTAPFDSNLNSYISPSLINYQTNVTFGAKTGSTESDSWVVGFNPNYTICVYVGKDDNTSLKNGKLAKQLFVSIADSLTKNDKDIYYKTNTNLHSFKIYNESKKTYSNTYYSLY